VLRNGRNSAAHRRKWNDITAPLGFDLPSSEHFMIRSNVPVNVCVFVYMHLYERESERERERGKQVNS